MKGFAAEDGEGCFSSKSDLCTVSAIDNVVAAEQELKECGILFLQLDLILEI